MSCSGIHCAGCAGGAAVPVAPLVAVFGLAWIAEHLVEVAVVSATCAALAVAAVVALMRWTERREARYAAGRAIWAVRAEVAPALSAPVTPQVMQGAVAPAIVNNYHAPQFHFSGADSEQYAARVRQALTMPAREEIAP